MANDTRRHARERLFELITIARADDLWEDNAVMARELFDPDKLADNGLALGAAVRILALIFPEEAIAAEALRMAQDDVG